MRLVILPQALTITIRISSNKTTIGLFKETKLASCRHLRFTDDNRGGAGIRMG